MRPLRVTHLGEGYAASAYRVRTRAADRGEDLVLRLPKAPVERTAALLRKEARLLPALERIDFGAAIGLVTPR
ncbi:MAG: hypothetical protein WCQ48_00850, partial [Chloroflexota bacterium]